ncbi:ArsR/SmtB family transcription factor [Actinotalea fermentans]|uniref:Transcriptional regulator n=1 Tax=Actinotalea fermentans TaxID=43671 RepID=A0A511YYN6_9CELL|nr:metalloregulator ArsR/SmtB family transcription factor [Actinotalea fermentans]KGM17805.1 hypothetical protein N867_11440 [Actinotalea fermentans ATCC 43279 = JCM 9966 = DSM 3133]GEN80294.1 transcriptional regulator [Actinotalea fermentans]
MKSEIAATRTPRPSCALVGSSITDAEAAELAHRLRAIAEPGRLRLLSLIAAHENHEACVADLTDLVGLSQPTVSHHLKVLVEARFVTRSKRGVFVYYALEPDALGILGRQVEATCC